MLSPMGMCRKCYGKKIILDYDTEISTCESCKTKYRTEYQTVQVGGELTRMPAWLGDEIE